jgi:predicted porin
MNNKIKLAVAGAVLASASAANAGIVIPAGDWTLDINGNVNAFATWTNTDKVNSTDGFVSGGLVTFEDADGESNNQGINTGLLPAWLGFTGTTRQNDVDVSFTISMQPGVSENTATGDNGTPANYAATLWRQAFITFGDKSWGSVKLGKDLGIFAGQAILNDMTLLGVGGGSNGSGAVTTLGGIGSGYIYPAWKGQIAYTTPNMNGFQATIGITNPNQGFAQEQIISTAGVTSTSEMYQDRFGIEGQLMYSWTGDVSGKVWASGASYDVTGSATAATGSTSAGTVDSYTASAYDIGATINAGNLGVTAYWYEGDGAGTTFFGALGADIQSNKFKKRDSDGGYLQATYVIPTGTKLGVAYGVSNLDRASGETADDQGAINGISSYLVDKNERWTVAAYHPLTKHLNLVAEYNKLESESHKAGAKNYDSSSFSLGAILFF